jgi:hypothetical protein
MLEFEIWGWVITIAAGNPADKGCYFQEWVGFIGTSTLQFSTKWLGLETCSYPGLPCNPTSPTSLPTQSLKLKTTSHSSPLTKNPSLNTLSSLLTLLT